MSTNTALGSNFDGSTKSLSPATMLLTVAVPPAALQDFRALVAGILYHCHRRKED